jgi:hypothetical protein
MGKSARASVDAMLRHLAAHHDPKDFPSTAYERQDLIEAAGRRRLIEWHKDRRRYEVTPAGWRRLRRNGRLGLPALAIAGGIGAAASAAVLAMFWLPAERSAGDRAVVGAPVENARAPNATPQTAALPATPAAATDPAASPGAAPSEPAASAAGAEPAVPAQPEGDPATTAAKEPTKRPRHSGRAGGHRNWNFGRYRDERFAGSGR